MLANLARAGAELESAHAAVILLHGRGASADSMLALAGEIAPPAPEAASSVAFLAPQAPGDSWYPYSFLAPISRNEPFLSDSLQMLAGLIAEVEGIGLPGERLALVGFSQGACLALEFAARHARRYGAVAGLSGGLIGPPGSPRLYPGALDGSPVFLGCSDVDPHIPLARVQETAAVLERLGAQVTTRVYPGMGHTVNEDEVRQVRGMIAKLIEPR